MKNSKLLLGALLGLGFFSVTAQELSVDAMIRPRFEYRHGFQDVVPEDTEGSAFVSQRSSLLTKYSDEKMTVFLDIQSVNTWGDRPQLSPTDNTTNGGLRMNQAWAQIGLGKGWATKVGRQVISYDDQRILGGLGWADQQRTHDAALLKYGKDGFKMDLGFAFNQNGPGNFNNLYTPGTPATPVFQYKGMQYAHLNNKFSDKFSGSFLFINNQFSDLIDGEGFISRQTTGVYGKYKEGKFGMDFSGYYQFGEFVEGTDISAYDAAVNLTYKPGKTLFGLGVEVLSGNDTSTDEQEAFFPLYGTNHKFNGFQDFFYVGRHANNGGLVDVNAKAVIKTGEKSKLLAKAHYFSTAGSDDYTFVHPVSQATTGETYTGYLGTELDLVYIQKINAYSNIKIGYSQSFLDGDFADARALGTAADTQNWGWVMLTIKPNLFKYTKTAE